MSNITTINPTTEKPIKKYRVFSASEISATVKKARESFETWKKTDLDFRIKLIKIYSKILRKRKKELAL